MSQSEGRPNHPPASLVRYHLENLSSILFQWKKNRRFPPVLLLLGQSGIGKKEVVRTLTQWLLCPVSGYQENEISTVSGPCETCPTCIRFKSGNEVNVVEISSESEALKVEAFRKLKSTVGYGAHEGLFKIVWIFNADRMTLQAANSVLKLLEEPPRGWIFFLTANDASLLIPTIVSRCQAVRLKPLPPQLIHQLLSESDVESQKIKTCSELSQGSWKRALLFSKEETWEQKDALFEFLQNPFERMQSLMDWASQEPVYFELLMDLLEQMTSDLIRWTLCSPAIAPESYPWMAPDGKQAFTKHTKMIVKKFGSIHGARAYWLHRSEDIASVRGELLLPLNRKLLLQKILLPWLEGASL